MFTPLVVSVLTLATSIHGTSDSAPRCTRDAGYAFMPWRPRPALSAPGFHFYNVGKKTGGFSWQNLFYGAPLGAPMAILSVGSCRLLLRAGARQTRRQPPDDLRASGRPHHGGADRAPGFWARPAKPGCCISAARSTIRS